MDQIAFLIPLFPILAFGLIVFFTNRNHRLSAFVAIGGILAALVVAYGVLAQTLGAGAEAASHPLGVPDAVTWFPYGTGKFFMGWMVDPLAAVMLFMVTTVCLMIFIYSVGYMQEGHADEHGHVHSVDDPRYSRFFALISLFAGAMLALVISPNYLLFFMAWEVMGYCSYALIGFWGFRHTDEHHIDDAQVNRAKYAAVKAFMTTRVGDVLFFTGILFLFLVAGTLDFQRIFTPQMLETLAKAQTPIPGLPWISVICLLLLAGTIGKSAQFPLHIWLPDAMEGPTPVSALIHAATMVAAGVYLIARSFPLFSTSLEVNPAVMATVALVGAFTAAFAGTIALAQDDIKRVIAYSTISQLGYMVAGLGIVAYGAGTFHLFTHSFFKALLFLAAGAVIHGFGTNDMMRMGGLIKKMPITAWTFIIGALALMGIPPFAGFWSKDEVLGDALRKGFFGEGGHGPDPVALIVYLLLLAATFLTALYTTRQIWLTFLGSPRDQHAHDHAHESPPVMWGPLVVLAFFAIAIGFVNTPFLPAFGNFVGRNVMGISGEMEPAPFDTIAIIGMALSVGAALFGIALGWLIYGRRPVLEGQPDPLTRLGVVWTLLRNKYYLDEIYGFAIRTTGATFAGGLVRLSIGLSTLLFAFDRYVIDAVVNFAGWIGRGISGIGRWIDTHIVDGIVNGVGLGTCEGAAELKLIQTGRVQNYLLLAMAGAAVIALVFLFTYNLRGG